ncbi:accessory factor UbiK family protein [Polycyclovorans algicola]|uniref:accessory factor UbiK family protein n=1 Tax=Polycyclovorans algicola TaxID=616992 RepID=UPI0004A6BAD4|nr:accessory factor UbiK family protein [Polycyclovorans algicola]
MLDPRSLDALADRLAQALPPGMSQLRRELQDNFRVMLGAHLDKLDLVTRERFDVQAELLARTQARLKALEARLSALEQHAPQRR